jgi:hypothetical protein
MNDFFCPVIPLSMWDMGMHMYVHVRVYRWMHGYYDPIGTLLSYVQYAPWLCIVTRSLVMYSNTLLRANLGKDIRV